MRRTLCVALCFAAALLSGCSEQGPESASQAATPAAATEEAEQLQPGERGAQDYADEIFARESMPGKAVYAQHCAACHDGAVKKAPHKLMLGLMTPEAVLETLSTGLMKEQGALLDDEDKRLVSEYLAGVPMGTQAATAVEVCSGAAAEFDFNDPPRTTNWGLQRTNTRSISAADAGLDKASLADLRLKWAFAFPGANRARSQPTLAAGAIYVGSHNGLVYALDRSSGCVRWTYESAAEVRTGIVVDSWNAGDSEAKPRAYFGDVLGNVYGIDAVNGTEIWRMRADEHPNATITGTPSLHDGRLFVPVSSLEVSLAADPAYECCTGRGSVVAVDAASGEMLWQTYTIEEEPTVQGQNRVETDMYGPSGATVWNSPSIDAKRNQLYVGTGENMSSPATLTSDAIFAMDLETGKVKWVFQATPNDAWNSACDTDRPDSCPVEDGPDFDFGAATMLLATEKAGDLVIGGQKSGLVHALDPETGKLVWQSRVGRGGIQGGVHFGMASDGKRLYVPISDMRDGRTYPDPERPGLHALDPSTGQELWSFENPDLCTGRDFCHPGISQAITSAGALVLAGGMDGVMRVHDAATGALLWERDTTETIATLSGARAFGGSFGGGSAPVVRDGLVVLSSGYGIYGHMPGNLLMVLEAEEAPAAD